MQHLFFPFVLMHNIFGFRAFQSVATQPFKSLPAKGLHHEPIKTRVRRLCPSIQCEIVSTWNSSFCIFDASGSVIRSWCFPDCWRGAGCTQHSWRLPASVRSSRSRSSSSARRWRGSADRPWRRTEGSDCARRSACCQTTRPAGGPLRTTKTQVT